MNPDDPIVTAYPPYPVRESHWSSLSWGAIFAGATATLALQILLMMLGAGLGFALFSPLTDQNPGDDFSAGAVVIQGVTAVIALWGGGWVAGHFVKRTNRRVGELHGFMVWSVSTATAVAIVALGAGWMLGGVTKVVGGGLSLAGQPAAAAVSKSADLAKEAASRTTNEISSFVDEGVANQAAGTSRADGLRNRRDLNLAVTQFFTANSSDAATSRQAVVDALVKEGMSPADAQKTVDDWTASYQKLKASLDAAKDRAEQKAREVADKASKELAVFSLCAFVAFLIGAVAASLGGKHGECCAYKYDPVPDRPAV